LIKFFFFFFPPPTLCHFKKKLTSTYVFLKMT
jgi:hypothetical protein